MNHPLIIQGGMGMGVSNYILSGAVSRAGHMGVVSGTAIDQIFARRLQQGDPTGEMREALNAFPDPAMAARVRDKYFSPQGWPKGKPYLPMVFFTVETAKEQVELVIVANFAEIWLAKKGHSNPVGVNFLQKIDLPTLPSIYGVMLAGVDYVLMGAGIPREVPGVLDKLARNEEVSFHINADVLLPWGELRVAFDPKKYFPVLPPAPKRPLFLAIVSSATLAANLCKKASGFVDGFVVENFTAGGHNAPPRGKWGLNELGEPIYGPRDVCDMEAMRELGRPFWLAGSYGTPDKLKEALEQGAAGVQVGTAFAFCEESGFRPDIKKHVLEVVRQGKAKVLTSAGASPTGFPFKVLQLEGTLSDEKVFNARPRVCDLGYLRTPYKKLDGSWGYRCPAEPVESYVAKGGKREETVGRRCLCNNLLADVGVGQTQANGYVETDYITSGDDIVNLGRLLGSKETYSVKDVIEYLMAGVKAGIK